MTALGQESSEQREIETRRIRNVMREDGDRNSLSSGCRWRKKRDSLDQLDAVAQFVEDDE